MAEYSIWVLGESNIALTGGVTLDGITQGDGSHLDGEFLTINALNFEEVLVSDAGTETNFADNDSGQTLNGTQTIDGVTYSGGTRIEAEYEFVVEDATTGIQYTILAVNISNSSPSYGTNEAIAFVDDVPPIGVALRVVGTTEGPGNSGATAIDEDEIVPICFCAGTMIETAGGDQPVEELRSGDRVRTVDGGFQSLRRVYFTRVSDVAMRRNAKLRPVRITAGALGGGLPVRDLWVSRHHRMLVSSSEVGRLFGQSAALIPAIRLTEFPGIFEDSSVPELVYVHLLFEQHEVVFAEGAPAESLFPGPEAIKALPPYARKELFSFCPELRDTEYVPKSARFIPSAKKQRRLVSRHVQSHRPLLEGFSPPLKPSVLSL